MKLVLKKKTIPQPSEIELAKIAAKQAVIPTLTLEQEKIVEACKVGTHTYMGGSKISKLGDDFYYREHIRYFQGCAWFFTKRLPVELLFSYDDWVYTKVSDKSLVKDIEEQKQDIGFSSFAYEDRD